MLPSKLKWTLILAACGFLAGSLICFAQPGQKPPASVETLIKQLGHPQFAERNQAALALEKMGSQALPALRQALQHDDPEVARRVKEIIQKIEQQSEVDHLLQPTQVELDFQQTTLETVIKELAKQTKFVIEIADDQMKQQKITIKTGKVSFWQALDQLCQLIPCQVRGVAQESPERNPFGNRGQIQQGLPPNLPRINLPAMPGLTDGAESTSPPKLRLEAGEALTVPQVRVGALSIRALPIHLAENPRVREYTGILLEVRPEPALQWNGPIDLRMEPLKDELQQPVEVTTIELSNRLEGKNDAESPIAAKRFPWNQQLVLLLRPPENPGKRLPSFKGTLVLPIVPAQRPLITVSNLASIKKTSTHTALSGEQLTIQTIDVKENGEVILVVEQQMEWTDQAPGNQIVIRQGNMRFQGNFQVQVGGVGPQGKIQFEGSKQPIAGLLLYDEDGQIYGGTTRSESMKLSDRQQTRTMTIYYSPPQKTSKPDRLVWLSSRPTTLEVPFELKDLPMPK